MKKRKINYLRLFIILFILILIPSAIAALIMWLPNFEEIPLYKYYSGLNAEKIYIVVEDELKETPTLPLNLEGEIYLPVDFVKDYIDPYIFWDSSVKRLTVTTENKVLRMSTRELNYFVNNTPMTLQLPVHEEESIAFLPASLIEELYAVEVSYQEEYNLTVITYTENARVFAETAAKKTRLRYEPDKKSPIEETLEEGRRITVYETAGDFTKVRTEDGLIGYILTKELLITDSLPESKRPDTVEKTESRIEGKINLVWDQKYNPDANASIKTEPLPDGLDVLAPTWFSFDEETLEINNIADKAYVDFAHGNGRQVWALITDNFNSGISHRVLSDTEVREEVIRQLLAFVAMYGLDGINIDFEQVPEEDGEYYLQFLRELYPFMKEQGAILSVDLYVPSASSAHYNRAEVAKTVDYMMIMAYDEHWRTSPVGGSVASIGFVEKGIKDTLDEIGGDAEKIILGLPYYVRIWRYENGDELTPPARDVGMDYAVRIFDEQGAGFQWDVETYNYYGEYQAEEEGIPVTYKTWLENARSIEEKLKLLEKYGLAGAAGWSKGLESEEIWLLLEQYLKKEGKSNEPADS